MVASSRLVHLVVTSGMILFVFALAGCGGRGTAIVEGKVTLDGQPLSAGRVVFLSPDGKTSVIAKLAPDGSYHATEVPCEVVKVTVTPLDKFERIKTQRGAKGKGSGISEAQADALEASTKIPEKYSDPDASGLTLTVKSGTNTYHIEIASEKN